MWPNSPAYPCFPRSCRPSATRPPPTPTSPWMTRMSLRSGSPARASATAARLASLSMPTGCGGLPSRSRRRAATGTSRQPRFGARLRVPVSRSMSPAMPTTIPTGTPPCAWRSAMVSVRSSESRSMTRSGDSPAASRDSRRSLSTSPWRSRASVATWCTLISAPMPQTRCPSSSTTVAGRPTEPRSSPASCTRPRSVSSVTRLETVALLSRRSEANRARERGPESRRARSTRERLERRRVAWSAAAEGPCCQDGVLTCCAPRGRWGGLGPA